MEKTTRTLSKHIDGHYRLVGIQPGVVVINNQSVDFRTISKARADALFEAGCRYLEKVPTASAKPKAE